MKPLILTTQTSHHAKFVQDIAAAYPGTCAVLETRALAAPFETGHAYTAAQDAFERETFFSGADCRIDDLVPARAVESVNDEGCMAALGEFRPDILIVFGTGRIKPALIAAARVPMLNLHGGDPAFYRGLDTHLWAIYHGEFDQLVTTLHEVEAELDTGAVAGRQALPLRKGMKLHELRAVNTKACVDLTLAALRALETTGKVQSEKLSQRGRYYSFMPSDLKDICVRKFEKYTEGLS